MKKAKKPDVKTVPVQPEHIGDIVEVALQIAEERAKLLGQLKAAILANDNDGVFKFAKLLCGL